MAFGGRLFFEPAPLPYRQRVKQAVRLSGFGSWQSHSLTPLPWSQRPRKSKFSVFCFTQEMQAHTRSFSPSGTFRFATLETSKNRPLHPLLCDISIGFRKTALFKPPKIEYQ
jgi:hypothetical protein